jgi:hypothetical protein
MVTCASILQIRDNVADTKCVNSEVSRLSALVTMTPRVDRAPAPVVPLGSDTVTVCPTAASSCKKMLAGAKWGRSSIRGRVASGDCSPEAPTDPDMRIFRIRLFGSRLRYVTGEEMCGCGSG